ncbi:unnamed protein product [Heligmosomoides polygyrus]|uniref:Reverse transcriptase domain-containing protein n=1 Tax=Heligmosomoides polygyrus TaxID=6339 RepID=A0A183GJ59_HELPZ|nr:unnamed protein product [Heligmosomoides polygyrus]
MDAITRDLQKPVPWTLLYADDVMLACEDKDDLERESGSIKINGTEFARTSVVKYLGSAIASDGDLMVEVNSRLVQVALSIRSVAMCGAECWPATKEVETRLSVMETKMLRWTAGVTRMDRIRSDAIQQKFGVAPIAGKMREARLREYGHVLRGKEDSVRKIGLELEVSGKRPRGRPKQRWSDTLHTDMKVTGVGKSGKVAS